jgi:hypothetical protein
VIATLLEMPEKLEYVGKAEIFSAQQLAQSHAITLAWKGAKNQAGELGMAVDALAGKALGGSSGLEAFSHVVETLGYMARGDTKGYVGATKRREEQKHAVSHADEIEKTRVEQSQLSELAKKEADARARSVALLKEQKAGLKAASDTIFGMVQGSEAVARTRYMADLSKGGLSPGDPRFKVGMERYDNAIKYTKAKDLERSVETPEESFNRETELMEKLYKDKQLNDETYNRLADRYLNDYWRKKANLDTEQLRKELATPSERFHQRMGDIGRWEKDQEALGNDVSGLAGRAREKAGMEGLRALGIKDSEADYRKAIRELDQARDAIGEDAYTKRRKELRRGAVDEMTRDSSGGRVNATPALEQGSREAYSAIVNSIMSDPKIALQTEANRKLDAIERNIAIMAGRTNQQLEVINK